MRDVVAVIDVGKTNVKLTAADADGRLLETRSTPNPAFPGPPYRHHDVRALETWLLDGLRVLGARHAIGTIVATGHGSGGVLVDADGPAMPMIDYEQAVPDGIDAEYQAVSGSFRERGSPVMLGAAHVARQMLWLERGWPEQFAQAHHMLATPQYWSWRLSGVAASELTSLAAQSHLWTTLDGRQARLVERRGWTRLLPPLRPAWEPLGPLIPALQAAMGLPPDVRVLCGIHDSSANFYRYQAAGLDGMTVVSTGTWIAAISDRAGTDIEAEQPGLCINADVEGHPLCGMLTMGGREFDAVADEVAGPAAVDDIIALVASDTRALPSFGDDDGLFPGTARNGAILGPLADERRLRFALAVLYAALLTDRCLDASLTPRVILDGSFARDPLYGAIVAALNPDRHVEVNLEHYGVATGAALLASHATRLTPAPLTLETPPTLRIPGLTAYRDRWRIEAAGPSRKRRQA